jgi:hypothetical protein
MHSFMDAKLMARLLRQALAERGTEISHSESLELVARQFGVANWNILSARIEAAAEPRPEAIPRGWIRTGRGARFFRTGVDDALGAAWIESREDLATAIREDDFCTVMQSVDAAAYRGRRVRVRSLLRAEQADGLTIFFRVDGPTGSLRFENLQAYEVGGPLRGTVDWTERVIVLDVPEEATSLNYGFLLTGTGKGWARDFRIEPVDDSVPLNTPDVRSLPRPTNLGFTEAARLG